MFSEFFQCKIGSATYYKTLDFDVQTNLSYFQLTTGLTSVNLALRFCKNCLISRTYVVSLVVVEYLFVFFLLNFF